MADATGSWMSSKDAAQRIGITPRTLYRFIDEGQIPAYRIGRVIRLQRRDVESFLELSRVKPGTLKHLYPDAVTDNDIV